MSEKTHRPYISLLGRFHVGYDAQHPIAGLEGQKTQELLAYLLLQRQSSHQRERLASLLWPEHSMNIARKNLRHALWRIQSALKRLHFEPFLEIDEEDVQIVRQDQLDLDVMILEQAYESTLDQPGQSFDQNTYTQVLTATQHYQGDLLPNCYQDWCIFERERLQSIYLLLLDKLMAYCELNRHYEQGVTYGHQILRCDIARERTHRRLMTLYYQNGDRTAALRQFEQCCKILEQELGVCPSQRTVKLYEYICADTGLYPQTLSPLTQDTATELEIEKLLLQVSDQLAQFQQMIRAYLQQHQ
jgi:DNA-binding SARP family transcriptional activator